MSTDAAHDLLTRFARAGDQAAFADLVRAFAPLVWRVAMRRLGDAQLAEEAAQNVFVTLARKAPALEGRQGLAAWLHRAATLEASNLSRSRSRRDQRLNEMARLTQHTPVTPPPDTDTPAGPWLDDALDRLSSDERSLILGRFYEDRSFRDLGAALGKSEEAAKKQSQRALAKMESFLRRRGVTVPGMSLAALLGTEFSNAALPAHVTASIVTSTTAALATGAAAPSLITKLIIAMSTAKMTATATGVFLLLAATAGWQQHANASLRKELGSRKAATGTDPCQSAGRSGSSTASRQPRKASERFRALAASARCRIAGPGVSSSRSRESLRSTIRFPSSMNRCSTG